MTEMFDEVAASLEQRLYDLPDQRSGEEVSAYVSFVETTWTDETGQRRCDIRRFASTGLNPHHAMGIAHVGSNRMERDLDMRHYPSVPAFVPMQMRG